MNCLLILLLIIIIIFLFIIIRSTNRSKNVDNINNDTVDDNDGLLDEINHEIDVFFKTKKINKDEIKYLKYALYLNRRGSESKNTGGGGVKFGGYQGIKYKNLDIKGQRNVNIRIDIIERYINLKDKNVLDIGCNSGNFLFEVSNKINRGIGVDFDPKCINVCNLKKNNDERNNLEFYSFDLIREPLEIMDSLIFNDVIDVVFLFSICCKWVKDYEKLIGYIAKRSKILVIEINGTPEKKKSLIKFLHKNFYVCENITDPINCDDCLDRNLYLCQNPDHINNVSRHGRNFTFYDKIKNVYIKKFDDADDYKQNLLCMKKLSYLKFIPKINHSDSNLSIEMENRGKILSIDRYPSDFGKNDKEIINNICDTLTGNNIYHNDVTGYNLTRDNDGNISLIDFETCTFGKPMLNAVDLCNKDDF
jgi:SAM-dependent methyltransferase